MVLLAGPGFGMAGCCVKGGAKAVKPQALKHSQRSQHSQHSTNQRNTQETKDKEHRFEPYQDDLACFCRKCHGSHEKSMKYDKKQRAAWQCLSASDTWRMA